MPGDAGIRRARFEATTSLLAVKGPVGSLAKSSRCTGSKGLEGPLEARQGVSSAKALRFTPVAPASLRYCTVFCRKFMAGHAGASQGISTPLTFHALCDHGPQRVP